MNRAIALLRDRKRRQYGGVLSGVLFITAFLAILAGALVTELSSNFLMSRVLVNRVANQATVDSAVELSIDQLQNTPLENGCPAPAPVTVNSQSAFASNVQCVQRRVLAVPSTTGGYFNVDGIRIQLAGRNEYLVGDTRGVLYEYDFGAASTYSTWSLGGYLTGQPQAMLDASITNNVVDLVPVHRTRSGDCGPIRECVAVMFDRPLSL